MADAPFRRLHDGIKVFVRLTPKASTSRIQGLVKTEDGGTVLRVAVTTPPEAGKANEAMLKLLAKTWKLPKTSLSVASGATSRRKVILVSGDPDTLISRLTEWERSLP